jgi:hypothetical protein
MQTKWGLKETALEITKYSQKSMCSLKGRICKTERGILLGLCGFTGCGWEKGPFTVAMARSRSHT